jgi:hypothetical protein
MNSNYSAAKNKKFNASFLTNEELLQSVEEYNKRPARAKAGLSAWIKSREAWEASR